MTGAYVRTLRDGRWLNIEFDQLTDQEMEEYASEFPEKGWMWGLFLARWIRDHVIQSPDDYPDSDDDDDC